MRTALVVMPFASPDRPALGAATLKASLGRDGHECDVIYLNLGFARALGLEEYRRIGEELPYPGLLGEWVFSEALYGETGDVDGYVRDVLRRRWRLDPDDIDVALRARELAAPFVEERAREVRAGRYDLVGFSSTCAQNLGALAVARRIAEAESRPVIVFGGHNWTGEMGEELIRQFPFVDYAISGEADTALPELVDCVHAGRDPWRAGIDGLIVAGRPATGRAPWVRSRPLDDLPVPDHAEYFRRLNEDGLTGAVAPVVPLETSRGCWWGESGPCRFCGLNGLERAYRAKTADRVLAELRALAQRHPGRALDIVDNVVPEEFFSVVLPTLVRHPLGVPLNCKVRPTLSEEDVRLLAACDVSIKSGIESLDDHMLHLMGKGTRAAENIRLLRWCATWGVDIAWNLLYGVPGETVADYRELLALLPELSSLTPPETCGPIVLERFSPFFEAPAHHGFGLPRPAAAYRYVYPTCDEPSLRRIAYAFDHDYVQGLEVAIHTARLREEVRRWADRAVRSAARGTAPSPADAGRS